MKTYYYSKKHMQTGFSLIELLVSLVILAIGLLGLSSLQLTALQRNTSAYNRSVATTLAYDIADRMRANKVAVGSYITGTDIGPTDAGTCFQTACNGVALAAFDLDDWKCQLGRWNADAACNGRLQGDLPEGRGEITLNGTVFTITVMWDDERTGNLGTDCSGDPEVDLTCFSVDFQPPSVR